MYAVAGFLRIRRHSSTPSSPGMVQSRIAREGACSTKSSHASLPLRAVITLNPQLSCPLKAALPSRNGCVDISECIRALYVWLYRHSSRPLRGPGTRNRFASQAVSVGRTTVHGQRDSRHPRILRPLDIVSVGDAAAWSAQTIPNNSQLRCSNR